MSAKHEDPERRREESWRAESSLTSFHRDLMAGAVMGGVVHTIVAPIERAKLLLQTQESNMSIVAGGRRRFKGMLDCICLTVREEGIFSLWRGNGSSLRYYPSVALNFSLKDLYKNILGSGKYYDDYDLLWGASANYIAGAAAGCSSVILVYPLDIARTRLAADVGTTEVHQFRGVCHFLATIYRKDGIVGIYRGLPASLQGMVETVGGGSGSHNLRWVGIISIRYGSKEDDDAVWHGKAGVQQHHELLEEDI